MGDYENEILGNLLMKVDDGPWIKLASMPKFETKYNADDTNKTYISKRSSFTGIIKKNKTRRLFK